MNIQTFDLLSLAIVAYRASGNREKSLEYANQLISLYPGNFLGYVRVAEDLIATNRFSELKAFCSTTRSRELDKDLDQIDDWDRTADAAISALDDITSGLHRDIISSFLGKRKILIPIGDLCLTAQLMHDTALRYQALPLDWLFATPATIQLIITDDFATLLDQNYLQSQYPVRRCGHQLYGPGLFYHHDPSREPDRSAFQRRVERLRGLISTHQTEIVFFNTRLHTGANDLINLLSVLPGESKILSFAFAGDTTHQKPSVMSFESRILQFTFTCDSATTLWSKRTTDPVKYTCGRRIYCPYSSTYSHKLLGEVGGGNCNYHHTLDRTLNQYRSI